MAQPRDLRRSRRSPDGERFQPWWATRADLLVRAGLRAEASVAYERAIELTDDAAVRDYLERRRRELAGTAT